MAVNRKRDRAPTETGESQLREARLYQPLGGGKTRCLACAHRCLVLSGFRGICGVRENREGTLYTLVYGRAVAAEIDPIEKKPFYHFYPGSRAYSIATVGCNFHCRFCQNWAISQITGRRAPPGFPLPPEKVVREAKAAGCGSIAYTYTEPTVFIEYALDTARWARREGLSNVFVSNGYYTSEALEEMAPLIEAVNVDLKSFRDTYYRKVCGARLAPVLESIEASVRCGLWVEVTTLVVPGLNDSEEELRDIARFLARLGRDIPWHLSRFFPAYRLTEIAPTPLATLRRAREWGREEGLHHVYLGNVPGEREDTLCSQCGTVLLLRSELRLEEDRLVNGACPRCGRELAGVGLKEKIATRAAALA